MFSLIILLVTFVPLALVFGAIIGAISFLGRTWKNTDINV